MATIQHADLFFQEGNSDKEYHLQLMSYGDGYAVNFQYGRRGGTLNDGTKISGASLQGAQKVYNKILNEKLGKGYQETAVGEVNGVITRIGAPEMVPARPQRSLPNRDSIILPSQTEHAAAVRSPGFSSLPRRLVDWDDPDSTPVREPVSTPASSDIIFIPQLLNVIDEADIETFLRDDRYCAQEKKDGRHQAFHRRAGNVLVTNKKGKAIGYPASLAQAIQTEKDLLVDAEIIGDKFHAFDLLDIHGDDLRGKGYWDRYKALEILFSLGTFDTQQIKIVPLAVGYKAKKALYTRLKAEGREGMVFKLLDAPYTPGKAHQAMWKCKFYAELSARVCAGRDGKRSVGVELLEEVGYNWKFMGNVTIPPNKNVPAIGSVIEIRYLYVDGPNGALYQPFYKEPRDDVDESECLMSQVKYKPTED